MKITPLRSGKSEFLSVFNDMLDSTLMIEKGDPARLYNLRCSQIPYCPASVLINYGQRGIYRAMGMRMAFYVHVGTVVHTVMQSCLSQSGAFLGDYHCEECGKKYPMSHTTECCGFPTKYEEIEIDYKGIVGHIDGVFRDSKGRYWIIDYKTTSLASASSKEKNPGLGYKSQVLAYAVLIEKQFGIKVSGCMLIFLPRDNPWKPTIWETPFGPNEMKAGIAFLKEQRNLHRLTMTAQTEEDFKPLLKVNCGDPYCETCKKPFTQLLGTARKLIARNKYPIRK